MLRPSLRRSSFSLLALSALLLLVPACDCAGPTTPPPSDGGDGGGTGLDGSDAPGRDGAVDAPALDGAADGGACVPATETCDGIDQDCDGLTDEAVVEACGTDEGVCVAGVRTCAGGTFGTCIGETVAGTETCGDGMDEDCDAMIDEGCSCTDGATQDCGSDVGECALGLQTCAGGAWGGCVGEIGADVEICDGLDNDCDGTDDELFVDLGASCDGPDADACEEGVRVCSADGSGTTCDDATGDAAEVCGNSTDDDCDGATDEGCVCTDGMTQPCGMDTGECAFGTQTCSGGAWGGCVGGTGPSTELCNALDDDCDGTSDEGFVTGGTCDGTDADDCAEGTLACDASGGVSCTDTTGDSVETCNATDDDCDGTSDEGFVTGDACDGADADSCAEGTNMCNATGGVSCSDTTGDTVEVCNATDDDCDGTSDEGFVTGNACDGPDADACTEGTNMCNAAGGVSCSDTTGDSVEVCNGRDDDCDGSIDEGNPGGGVRCTGSTDVGACIARTACVAGAIVCRGTFVSAGGTATATGASNDPLPSITAAIANAGILGGGADVCVCDTSAAGSATFTEDVTMVEGTSVLGAYDCTTWTRPAGRSTVIQDVDADGVTFPAGITSATALEQMSVVGLNASGAAGSTAAITITNSSPTLTTDTVRAGNAATAMGLRVVETAGGSATPTVSGGSYSAVGIAGGTAIAVSLEASSPTFSMVTIGGASSGLGPAATTAYGVRCVDCGGTTFTAGNVSTSGATTTGYGFHGSGNLAGFSASMTSFGGGASTLAGSSTTGVRLDTCTGAPTFTNSSTNGGFSIGGLPANTTRTGFSTTGAACAPVVDGGRHVGCELGVNCYGIDASTGSALVVRNATLVQATLASADVAVGMRCLTGACASISGSTINVGNLTRSGPTGIGLELDGASPSVDDNAITGPNVTNPAIVVPGARYFGVYLRSTRSVLTNNLIFAGTHNQPQVVVQYDQTAFGPALIEPTIHSNTIEYSSCTLCGERIGLVVNGPVGALSGPMGVVRNNIIRHVGVGGITRAVEERNAQSDLRLFENNALFDSSGVLYLDEGTTPLATAMAINMLAGAAANQVVDCMLNATWHIPAASACRNMGTATGAPDHDFDGNRRPLEGAFDVGADEFVP